jgi:penicillin amidase
LAPHKNIPNNINELSESRKTRFVLAGGQSGNPLSPHYADLLSLWKRGEGVPIAWSEEKIDQGTVATLRLTPSKS